MGFMDKLKEAAQDVASEAKKATAQGKTKLDQIQTRKKADDAARRLGYLIHAERTKGTTAGAQADRLVAEISSLESALEAAQREEAQAATATPSRDPAGYSAPQPPPESTPEPPAAPPPSSPSSADPTPDHLRP
jgi:hypothetical protein